MEIVFLTLLLNIKIVLLQLRALFSIGIWQDIQDEEIPNELKVYVSRLPTLVLGSKVKNTYKNFMYNFKVFSKWSQKYGYKSVPAANHHVGIYLSYLIDSHPSVSKVNNLFGS